MNHYKMIDVVDEINDREKDPANSEYDRFVGLEHYVSGEVVIRNYGSTDKLESTMKIFKSGDILVARRNVYLKRASMVDFDGLTSGDSIVLRAKDALIGKILPFILNTDDFWDFADQYADGTMSKRLSPKVLMQYEFDLPDNDELNQLVDVLWAADDTREAYKILISETDELVKSQFIEMFAETPKGKLSDVSKIIMGQSPDGKTYNTKGDGMCFYQGKTEFGDLFIGEPATWTTAPTRIADADDVLMSVRAPVGSTNIATQTCCLGRGLAGIRPIEGKSTTMFILYSMRVIEDEIENMGVGSTFKAINKDVVHNLPIPIASIDQQNRFVSLAEQSDKSKFELKKAIENINELIRSLMQQDFSN